MADEDTIRLDEHVTTVTHHRGILSKAIGALFSQPLRDEAHIFHFNNEQPTIHTWFFTEPLHVVFLDADQTVLETHIVEPFDTVTPRIPVTYVVELPPEMPGPTLGQGVTWPDDNA